MNTIGTILSYLIFFGGIAYLIYISIKSDMIEQERTEFYKQLRDNKK